MLALLGLAFVISACGGGSGSPDTAGSSSETTESRQVREIKITGDPVTVRHANEMKPDEGGLVGSEPKPIIPSAPPPDFLAYQTLIEGDGSVAHYGDSVSIQYVGAEYKNGRQYTSSWDWGSPYKFEVGNAGLVNGFNLGVEGMKVGDRRELIIPPADADPHGTIGGIPDKETLIYVVDLLAVE